MGHANQIVMDVDSSDVVRSFNKFGRMMPEEMREGLLEWMNLIGLTSVAKYMQYRKVVDAATGRVEGRRSPSDKLGIVTSRLSRSILNQTSSFGNEAIRRAVVTGDDVYGEIGSKTPYAAIHEYGGRAGKGGASHIPARAYLNPAVDDTQTAGFAILKAKLELTVRRAESGGL